MRGKFHHAFLFLAALFLYEAALLVSCNRNATFGCVESERQALLKFKACFDDPSHMLSSWKGNDCCEWKGVGCDKNSNHVVSLALRGTKYEDTVPSSNTLDLSSNADDVASSLAELRFLEHLDLSGNYFGRNIIPPSFGLMEHLRYLNLSYAGFSGDIPHQLGNLTRLCILDLSHNNYGDLEARDVRWLSQLRSLEQLSMSRVDLKSATSPNVFQVLNNLPSLTWLSLSECGLNNSHLSLGGHPFNFTFLGNIQHLDLSVNHLSGDIGNSIGHLLELEDNQLNRSIPDNIRPLSKLKTLDLSSNQLIGTIPASIVQLPKLENILLSSNQLTGAIPASIGHLSMLKTLDLSRNHLFGAIPTSIGQLSNLQFLDVDRNYLEGVFSEAHFEKLANLKVLHIGFNRLNCAFRSDWRPPFRIEFISLNSCKLGTKFPKWLLLQKTTQYLDLSNASISGPLPENIDHMMPELDTLLLENNHINGSIPKSLCNLESLSELDISKNMLSGNIPDCWRNNALEVLSLASNNLSGLIPRSIGQLSSLQALCLSNNSMHGELVTLANCTNMVYLDVGENAFSGNITWIGESLHYLEILRLRRNLFSCEIPLQLCLQLKLKVLDLAENKFCGKIPSCFQNSSCMTGDGHCPYRGSSGHLREVMKGRNMEYESGPMQALATIDLSCNNLEGHIPKEIALLVALDGLNLSYNHLSGEIPENIGQMNNLESLDLSQNVLSGKIPSSLSELSMLVHLNLSHNNLSGPIPTGNQLQNLEDITTVYIGNPLLCGPPLLTKCSEDAQPPTSTPSKSKDDNEDAREKMWFYLIVMSGFATGLWGVIGALIFMKSWRQTLFRMVDNVQDKIHVVVALKMKQFKKMLNRNPDDE